MPNKLTASVLLECQARCEEQCPMSKFSTPDQINSALGWLNAPPSPPFNAEGEDISGVPTNLKDAILRCSSQILREACDAPVEINKRVR
jgi:hypothetical protein